MITLELVLGSPVVFDSLGQLIFVQQLLMVLMTK